MAKLILYYAHPAHRYSQANAKMFQAAQKVDGITCVDLYAEYPRFDIDVGTEQDRLLEHDVILFQFPMFWYSTPSLLKEWQDLVLEQGFAYGPGGTALAGKRLGLAITAAAPEKAYGPGGYQHYPIRDFLRPLEQTARLCAMIFLPPYVLYNALRALEDGALPPHVEGYVRLLEHLRDDRFSPPDGDDEPVLTHAAFANPKGV